MKRSDNPRSKPKLVRSSVPRGLISPLETLMRFRTSLLLKLAPKCLGLAILLWGIQAHAVLTITSPTDQNHVNLSGFSTSVSWTSSFSLISITPYVNGVAQSCISGSCSGTSGTFGLDTSASPLANGYCTYVLHLRGTDGFFNYDSQDIIIYDMAQPYTSCQGAPTRCTGGAQAADPQMGGPVSLATGKMWYEAEDIRIDGPLPLIFTRRFNHKRASANGPLGYGWTHNFNLSVSSANGSYIFRNEEGRDIYFTPSRSGIVDARRDHLSFAVISGGYRITDKYKTQWTFTSTTGKLTEIRDRNNNTLTLAYDGSARLSTVTDLFGRSLTFGYDASNRIQSVTDGTRTVNYTLYDANGNLQTVQDATAKNWSYAYADAAHIHNLTSITDPLTHVVEAFVYTAGDQVQTFQKDSGNELLSFTYTSATSTSVTNSVGAVTTATLDQYNGVATALTGPGCTECQVGNNVSYVLDNSFNKTQITDGNGNITQQVFDAQGNVTQRIEAFGTPQQRTINFTYQPTFNYLATRTEPSVDTAAQNRNETWSYSATTGDLLSDSVAGYSNGTAFTHTSAYTYDAHGQALTIDGPRIDLSDVTTNVYYADNDADSAKRGRLHTITNPLGQVTTINSYTLSGKPTVVLDLNTVETDYAYDNLDRLTNSTVKGAIVAEDLNTSYTLNNVGLPTQVTLPRINTIGFGYDSANRLTTTTDGLGNKIVLTYDLQGRRSREEYQDPGSVVKKFTNFSHDNLNRQQKVCFDGSAGCSGSTIFYQYSYDNNSNLTSILDPNGHLTCHDYDPLNHRKATRQFLGTQPASCAAACTGPGCTLIQTQFGYDTQNHLTSDTDPINLTTTYKVDDEGWTLRETSPDRGITNYTYDSAGNLKTKIDANGITVSRSYDALNRLTTITYPDTMQNIGYNYDDPSQAFGKGHRTGMIDPVGSTAFTYDRFGRLTQENRTINGGTNYFTVYSYDKNGNLTGLTYPSGRQASNTYDNADQFSGETAQINGASTTLASSLAYAPFGPRTGLTFGNGLADARSYDNRYRLQNWTVGSLISKTHTWSNDDTLTGITDNLTSANNRVFGYDATHRLATANGPWGTGGYTYDANGNRQAKTEGAVSVNYTVTATTNRLANATGSEPATFTYDNNGNTTSDGTHTYQYNQRNRLATVDTGTTGSYDYDGEGRRVKKNAGATTLYFYTPSGMLLEEYVPAAALGKDYLWQMNSYEPLSRVDFTLSDTDNGNVLRNTKSSPNAHLDWTLDAATGSFVTRRSATFNFANPVFLGSAQSAKTFDDPILSNANSYAYSVSRRTLTDTLFYLHADHLGTPIAITNSTSSLVWRTEHLPFGGLFSVTGTAGNNLRFSGQYYDAESGLNQNFHRDYSSLLGRYSEPDSYFLFLEQSQLYPYVGNNPATAFDPKGLYEHGPAYHPPGKFACNPGQSCETLGKNKDEFIKTIVSHLDLKFSGVFTKPHSQEIVDLIFGFKTCFDIFNRKCTPKGPPCPPRSGPESGSNSGSNDATPDTGTPPLSNQLKELEDFLNRMDEMEELEEAA